MKLVKKLLLITLVISFVGCGVFSEPEIVALEGNNLEGNNIEGMSKIKINIDRNGRTILPNMWDGFSKFEINAEPNTDKGNSESAPEPVEIIRDYYGINTWGDIRLPYGEWFISVTAFINVEDNDYAVAKGSIPFKVEAMNHNIVIPVNTPVTEGQGVFGYRVTYPSSGTISLKLDTWPITSVAHSDSNFTSDDFRSFDNVDSGVYFLTISVTANGKTITRNEIVHIYQHDRTQAIYDFTYDF